MRRSILLAAALLAPNALGSQTVHSTPEWGRTVVGVGLEAASGVTATTLLRAALAHPINARTHLTVEWPVVIGADVSTVQSGNPFLGVLVRGARTAVSGEFGVRLPLSGQSQLVRGGFALTAPDRGAEFLDDVAEVSGSLRFESLDDGLFQRARLGLSIWMDDLGSTGTEMFIHYAGAVGYRASRVEASVGISGRSVMSGGSGNLGERTLYQGFLSIGVGVNERWTLDALGRLPVEDFTDDYDLSLGLGVSFRP